MSLTQALITEIEQESIGTQKMLECVPEDKMDWRPHPKSMTLKQLSSHIANLSGMAALAINTSYFDFAEMKSPAPQFDHVKDLVAEFQKGTHQTLDALKSIQDEDLKKNWVLRAGPHVIVDTNKAAAIRKMALSHLYHHRAQLSVYLRLLDIPIPGMYGPSADDRAKQA